VGFLPRISSSRKKTNEHANIVRKAADFIGLVRKWKRNGGEIETEISFEFKKKELLLQVKEEDSRVLSDVRRLRVTEGMSNAHQQKQQCFANESEREKWGAPVEWKKDKCSKKVLKEAGRMRKWNRGLPPAKEPEEKPSSERLAHAGSHLGMAERDKLRRWQTRKSVSGEIVHKRRRGDSERKG